MRLDIVWLVRDPGPLSTMGDILTKVTAARLDLYILARAWGARGADAWRAENTAVFSDLESAFQEAERRLSRRDCKRCGECVYCIVAGDEQQGAA